MQSAKQRFETVSIEAGIQIDRSDKQHENTDSLRFETREPASNVKTDRLLQLAKQPAEIVAIDEGIQIDRSDEQSANAYARRCASLDRG
jgi:hypothetical protein